MNRFKGRWNVANAYLDHQGGERSFAASAHGVLREKESRRSTNLVGNDWLVQRGLPPHQSADWMPLTRVQI